MPAVPVVVPIPNQPVFTWPITISTINVRGKRINTSGVYGPIGVYGSVLTGTRKIVPIIAGPSSKYRHGFFAHGFQMPSKTVVGASRLRIPLIVHIWNYVVTGVHVIAHVGGTDHEAAVYAEASHDVGSMSTTYMMLSGIETEKNIRLVWSVGNIKRHVHDMILVLPILRYRASGLMASLHDVSTGHAAKMLAKLHLPINAKSGIFVRLQHMTELPMKVFVNTFGECTLGVFSIFTSIENKLLGQAQKIRAALATKGLSQVNTRLITRIATKGLSQVGTKLFTQLSRKSQQVGNVSTKLANKMIEKTFKLKVAIMPMQLQEVMSYIMTFLIKHKMIQKSAIRTAVHKGSERKSLLHMEVSKTVSQRIHSVFSVLVGKAKKLLGFNLHAIDAKQKIDVVIPESKTETQIKVSPMEVQVVHAKIKAQESVEGFARKYRLMFHNDAIRNEQIYAEFVLLPLIARDREIRFMPHSPVEARELSVMVTVCETWVLAYLNFVPSETIKQLQVSIGLCSHFATSMLQWYLHGGRVSNEGVGNHVVFDLGDVDPLNPDDPDAPKPVPPVPSRQWDGGYVEDPFKGVGYVPASDSVGYLSPSASEWISNAKMWWNKPTKPFQGGE